MQAGVPRARAAHAANGFAHVSDTDFRTKEMRLPGELFAGNSMTVLAVPADENWEQGRTPVLRVPADEKFIAVFNGKLFGYLLPAATLLYLNPLVERISARLGLRDERA